MRVREKPFYLILLAPDVAKRRAYPGGCTIDTLISLEAFGDCAQILARGAP